LSARLRPPTCCTLARVTATIELRRKKGPGTIGIFLVGQMFLLGGLVMLDRPGAGRIGGAVFFFAIGATIVLVTGRQLLARSPRFRATSAGVWFGGGAVIPWTEIKSVFEAGVDVRGGGISGRSSSIAFEFHRRSTLFRTPPEHWLATLLAVGDLDVGPDTGEKAAVLASKLEAMRVQVVEGSPSKKSAKRR
jgi:hypothetical protein